MIRADLCQGDELPQWYGIAWHDFNRDIAVCYPVPLHLLLGWGRFIWNRLRFHSVPTHWDTIRQAYEAGHLAGRQYEMMSEPSKRALLERAP